MAKRIPRSLRNHNPLNIKRSAVCWQGESYIAPGDPAHDPTFEQFETDHLGLRAAARLLANYQKHKGFKTVRDIIAGKGTPGDKDYLAGWAPNNENDTENYVKYVCRIAGVKPDQEIELVKDVPLFVKVMAAMCAMESGYCPFFENDFVTAIKAAGVLPA